MSRGRLRAARSRPAALVTALLLALTACTAAGGGADGEDTLTVLAAASLEEPVTELAEEFEAAHPGVRVELGLAGSSTLVSQIREGAPADVVATANTATMDQLAEDDQLAADPVVVASNTLVIAVPPGNPAGITTLDDLADPDLSLVVCAPQVPCGDAAARVLEAGGVDASPVSEEQSVTDVLTKVSTGQADAGLVYVTDVSRADGAVEGIAVPEAEAAVNLYPIAPVVGAADPEAAAAFVDLVRGERGRAVLAEHGFAAP